MITNILVVPLSTLIIYTGILLLILGSVPLVSVLLAKLLIVLVWLLNNSIHFIEGWPFAVTRGVHINLGLTICIYLLILAMALYLLYKRKKYLFMFLLLSVILSAGVLYKKVYQLKSASIIIYGARNLPAVDFISGGASVFLYHPEVMNNDYFSENHLITYEKMKIRKSTNKMLPSGSRESPGFSCYGCFYNKDGFIRFFDKRIYILNRKLPKTVSRKFYLDKIIIHGNPAVTIDQIRKIFEVREIIVDPSNSWWRSDTWKKEGAVNGVKVSVVNETGACVIDL
jgi:competence protein ComEC